MALKQHQQFVKNPTKNGIPTVSKSKKSVTLGVTNRKEKFSPKKKMIFLSFPRLLKFPE